MVVNGATKFGDMKHFEEQLASFSGDVTMEYLEDDMQLLAIQGQGAAEAVKKLLPESHIVVQASNEAALMKVLDGSCNALFAGSNALAALAENTSDYVVGSKLFSREPLALVTREDDPRFTDFVNWILQAVLSAEEQNTTQLTAAATAPETVLFGETFSYMFINAIQAVGNCKYKILLLMPTERQKTATNNSDFLRWRNLRKEFRKTYSPIRLEQHQ